MSASPPGAWPRSAGQQTARVPHERRREKAGEAVDIPLVNISSCDTGCVIWLVVSEQHPKPRKMRRRDLLRIQPTHRTTSQPAAREREAGPRVH